MHSLRLRRPNGSRPVYFPWMCSLKDALQFVQPFLAVGFAYWLGTRFLVANARLTRATQEHTYLMDALERWNPNESIQGLRSPYPCGFWDIDRSHYMAYQTLRDGWARVRGALDQDADQKTVDRYIAGVLGSTRYYLSLAARAIAERAHPGFLLRVQNQPDMGGMLYDHMYGTRWKKTRLRFVLLLDKIGWSKLSERLLRRMYPSGPRTTQPQEDPQFAP
jgi:hypothetical protein